MTLRKNPEGREAILHLVERSRAILAAMTEEERQAMWQAQRESFVRGMTTPCEHGVLDFEQCQQCRQGPETGAANPDNASATTGGSDFVSETGELCPVCATDIEMGICHAACLEGSPVVDLETGEPIEGARVDTYRYGDVCEPTAQPASSEIDRLRIELAAKEIEALGYLRTVGDLQARLAATAPSPNPQMGGSEIKLREAAQALIEAQKAGQQHVGYRLDLWSALAAAIEAEARS